jgi:hypothetical protein
LETGEPRTQKSQSAFAENPLLPPKGSEEKLEEPFTFKADKRIAFRLYPDNRPRNLEIATLQKGLVLVANGAELIEEGAGFGVPIAKYADRTYFSGSAEVILQKQDSSEAVVSKVFLLDCISEKQAGSVPINHGFYSFFHSAFERTYLNRKGSSPLFDWAMRLRKTLGVQTQFVTVKPRGTVAVTYRFHPDHIEVHVDLSALDRKHCREILILNKQGASFFRKYSDADGEVLCDGQIGAWTKVKAKHAAFSDFKEQLSFSLESTGRAVLYRGREQVKDRFSWAGLSYAVNPRTSQFDYAIRIGAASPR